MFISTTGIPVLCKSMSPLECIVVVYKHFDRSIHVGSLDPNYVQNCRPKISLTVFEILGFKLKKNNDNYNKNWREYFVIVNILPCIYNLTKEFVSHDDTVIHIMFHVE